MKFYLFIALSLVPFLGSSQWTKTELRSQKVKKSQEKLEFSALYSLNTDQLKQALQKAPARFANDKGVIVSLPAANGKLEKFQVWEFSNMAPELQAKYPDIKSYVGTGVEDPSVVLRFSLSPVGFSSMIIRSGISEFIEPFTEDRTVYAVFDSKARRGHDKEPFECSAAEMVEKNAGYNNGAVNKKAAGFNVFRMALSCTGEYAQYHLTTAGTPATATDAQKKAVILSAMNASLTRMNGVFEKDLSIHFNLIANNDAVIFLDSATDPYSVGAGPDEANAGIITVLSASDFDMGHLLDKKDANGAAYGDALCGAQPGRGWTACNFPEGDTYDIDYVAHEMGHQMGAGHTYTSHTGQANQRVEPASGSTIMAYTGIIGGNLDVQFNSNDYYHINSINQVKARVANISCGINTPFTNPAPSVTLGGNYTIPKSTPFVLKGTTTDAGSASYTYTIEQTDQAATAQMGANSFAYAAKPSGPTFRSKTPTTSPVRYFPDFNTVLSGVLTTRWESVSDVGRPLSFNMSVRNNNPVQPQVGQATSVVTVNAAAGPFKVTAPAFGQSLASGTSFNVTWDVAATNAAPINTANVNIKLSTDGGLTFTTIAANTANDGSEQVTVPAGSSSANAFVLIEAVGNVYYAVSPSFVIDYSVTDEACTTYTYNGSPVAITDGPGGGNISSPIVTVPLMVNNTGTITRIKVTPAVTHPNVRHLSIGIESPVGSSALIWNRSCNANSGITASFSDAGNAVVCASPVQGETKSYETLAIFKGHKAQGQWKLFASDNNPGSAGSITGWSLEVCTQQTKTLGTKETSSPLADDIRIYPNPSDGKFFIKSRNIKGEMKVTVFDSSGRLISSDAYQSNGDFTKEFNLNVSKGVYMININSPKGAYNQKLIIK
ncbi:Por secretion system C-terminal sorting domain-containing protein [Chryseobacterium oleae]|uniref:Por secretion system C-terminal sorting domain-containing protein n=1 Tax=Chryseobacterium oleae TaxID=491207 RepID=A0A1I4XNP7_CHROL|nr:zinc-dependent metalloprotease family protein [Chryseobacterium oleae]SFN27455.1 Por secretion system C-terminal sorting domain-containing protein [Chryseobacterium oleae]